MRGRGTSYNDYNGDAYEAQYDKDSGEYDDNFHHDIDLEGCAKLKHKNIYKICHNKSSKIQN